MKTNEFPLNWKIQGSPEFAKFLKLVPEINRDEWQGNFNIREYCFNNEEKHIEGVLSKKTRITYTIVTIEDLYNHYIHKNMKKYTKEELNNYGAHPIVVHVETKEQWSQLKNICPQLTGYSVNYIYYLTPGGGYAQNKELYLNKLINYNIIEFNQIDFMEEIIGYKLIKPQFKSAAQAIMDTCFPTDNLNVTVDLCIQRLKDAGVLEIWFEPVYKEKFKIGDWIIADDAVTPEADEIINICPTHYQTKDSADKGYGFPKSDKSLRLATLEEIKEAKSIIIIGGYDAEVVGGEIKIGCVYLSEYNLRAYKYLLTSAAKAKIEVHGVIITEEIINNLLNKLGV